MGILGFDSAVGCKLGRKCVVKVIMSKEQKIILHELSRRLGVSESEMLRTALMDYAKELSMVRETLHQSKLELA